MENISPTSLPERIGRYLRADLEAMHGKRGRKPPEYFQVFPERQRAEVTAKAPKAAKEPKTKSRAAEALTAYDADPLAVRLATASPEVRQLIANLLDLVTPAARARRTQIEEPLAEIGTAMADISPVVVSESVAPVISDPVYADPEIDTQLVGQG